MIKKMTVAKIAVSKLGFENDILYSYRIPENCKNIVKAGQRVVIPFGVGNAKRTGFIMELSENDKTENLKEVYAILDPEPFISDELINVIKWLKSNCFCTYFEAAKSVFPCGLGMGISGIKYKVCDDFENCLSNLNKEEILFLKCINKTFKGVFTLKNVLDSKIKNYNKILNSLISRKIIFEEFANVKNVGEKTIKFLKINEKCPVNFSSLTPKQRNIYDYIKNNESSTVKEVCYFTGISESTVRTLIKKQVLICNSKFEYTSPENGFIEDNVSEYIAPKLNAKQQKALESLMATLKRGRFGISLLHGVTGSGKTEVLLNLVDHVLKLNKSVIFMVPEIALTSQFAEVFRKRYKSNVAIIHSNLSDWQRFDYWKKINEGKCNVILGTRSAVFAPAKNLGLIVIDEEHEYTYKSESSPRFNAKEVAKYRSKYNNSFLVFSSATPSVESYYNAKIGNYHLVTLNHRFGEAKIPDVQIVDMNGKSEIVESNQLSEELLEALRKNLVNKKQSLIFINRRGYSTFAKCRNCGEVLTCPNCSVSLNYHKSNGRLMCHYCGHSKPFTIKCPKCEKDKVVYMGSGTQKIEDILYKDLPNARILRMDSDNKNLKEFYSTSFKDFTEGKYDILVGTQMIAKGFNFPNVTLVGVVSADHYLYSEDFRSYEKTFSLLTQVSGRSGRYKTPGKAIIQTFTPECEIFKFASEQNYNDFFNHEISMRKSMLYPPFADICVIGFVSENERSVLNFGINFFEFIKKIAKQKYPKIPLRIFPPGVAAVKKVSGKYRYRIVMKCKNNKEFRNLISESLTVFLKENKLKNVHVFADINPDMIL